MPIGPNEENSKITKFTLKLESYLDIPNKNKLASEITKNNLKTLDNSNYLIEYTFSPNDVTKTLQIIVKITSKKKSNLLKTFNKTFSSFKAHTPIKPEQNLQDEISKITFNLKDSIKNNASNTLASTNPKFNQDNYNWKVEADPNDVGWGMLHTKITIISKTNPSNRAFKYVENIAEFKKYTLGEITNIIKKTISKVSSTQEILNDL